MQATDKQKGEAAGVYLTRGDTFQDAVDNMIDSLVEHADNFSEDNKAAPGYQHFLTANFYDEKDFAIQTRDLGVPIAESIQAGLIVAGFTTDQIRVAYRTERRPDMSDEFAHIESTSPVLELQIDSAITPEKLAAALKSARSHARAAVKAKTIPDRLIPDYSSPGRRPDSGPRR